MKGKYFTTGAFLAIFVIGFVAGVWVMIISHPFPSYNCYENLYKTCQYANNLTSLVNLESETLSLCTGHTYEKLKELNCDLIKIK